MGGGGCGGGGGAATINVRLNIRGLIQLNVSRVKIFKAHFLLRRLFLLLLLLLQIRTWIGFRTGTGQRMAYGVRVEWNGNWFLTPGQEHQWRKP